MGGVTFSCSKADCVGDDDHSEEIPRTLERMEACESLEISNTIMIAEREEIFQNVDRSSTPDTASQESVMSAISPTKDRAPSPQRYTKFRHRIYSSLT